MILVSATAISLGTAAGGWRIIKTMGQRVVKLDPVHGFAAETTAATIILGASQLRHAGLDDPRDLLGDHRRRVERRLSAVRWGVAGNIVIGLGPDDPGLGALSRALAWVVLSRLL